MDMLVLLPLNSTVLRLAQPWERGPELLPGAILAVEHVNSDPGLLQNVKLGMQVVPIDPCNADEFATNINALTPFADIAEGTGNSSKILALIGGPFCPELLDQLVSPLAHKPAISLFQLLGSTSENVQSKGDGTETGGNFITPSIGVYYEALYAMMRKFKWENVFVLAERFFQGASSIQGSSGLNITYRQLTFDIDVSFQELRRSAKKIVFASVSVQNAVKLLCKAVNLTFAYPNYVWVFSDITAATIRKFNSVCDRNKMEELLQNVFFLNFPLHPEHPDTTLVSGFSYFEYFRAYRSLMTTGEPNSYANVFYDSVWGFALSLNRSLTAHGLSAWKLLRNKTELVQDMNNNLHTLCFEGATGFLNFSAAPVNAVVAIHKNNLTVGKYTGGVSPSISLRASILNSAPSDQLDRRYGLVSIYLAMVLAAAEVLCLILTTVILSLFLHFRNDPEIKAASPNLSYIMFVGCYLLFFSSLLHSVTGAFPIQRHVAVHSVCGIVIIGDSLGVNIIFTTLLLRLMRIYRVFSYFGKTGKLWSDKFMFLIIVFVIAGDVMLILVWSLVDTFRIIEVVIYHPLTNPPFFEIRQFCHSDHLSVWLGILLGKLGILFVIVLVLAVKTRKISRSNFKDTKKVNAYIFVTVLVVIFPMALYSLLRATNNNLGTYLTLYMVFTLVGLLCQLFLFLPKVLGPILRRRGYEVSYDGSRRRLTIVKQEESLPHLTHLMRTSFSSPNTRASV